MTDSQTTSPGQALLAAIELNVLTAFGAPLLSFLTQVQAAAGDPIKISAAFIGLQGAIIAASPSAIAGLETQLAATLAGKLQQLQADLAAKASGRADAAPGPSVIKA